MTRERGEAGLAKGEVGSAEPSRPFRGRRITNKANRDAGTPGGSPGGSSVRSDAFSDRANTSTAPKPATAEDVVNLFKLFRKGNYDDARALLKRPGMSVDVVDKFGNTRFVAPKRPRAAGKMCVRYGADERGEQGNTALHFAQYGFDALGDFRGERREQDARNDDGRTPHESFDRVTSPVRAVIESPRLSSSHLLYVLLIRGRARRVSFTASVSSRARPRSVALRRVARPALSPTFVPTFVSDSSQLVSTTASSRSDSSYAIASPSHAQRAAARVPERAPNRACRTRRAERGGQIFPEPGSVRRQSGEAGPACTRRRLRDRSRSLP